MRKLNTFLLFTVLLFTFYTHAQKAGIIGGMNLASMSFSDTSTVNETKYSSVNGFHFGLRIEFPISEKIFFEPGFVISKQGSQFEFEETTTQPDQSGSGFDESHMSVIKTTVNSTYLNVPLNVKVKFAVKNSKIFVSAGPYLGLGMGGTMSTKTNTTITSTNPLSQSSEIKSETEDTSIPWGSHDTDFLKKMDFGLGFGTGIEVKKIQIGVGYNLGFANISTNTENIPSIKNKVLQISIGYYFDGD